MKNKRDLSVHRLLKYFSVALTIALIANIYTLFGRGGKSSYMDFAFLVPVVFGLIALVIKNDKIRLVFNYGMWILISFCLLRGIIVIAGSVSSLTIWYLVIGAILSIGAMIAAIIEKIYGGKRESINQ